VKQFGQASRAGAYLRILKEGQVAAGDAVEVDVASLPDHGVTLRLVSDAILLDHSLIPHALEAPQMIPSLRAWMTARPS
jgi:MOSC domain-containing protein YiiM